MKILGINCSAHDTGVAYIKDGKIMCALEEEKMVGIKSRYIQWKMPTESMNYLLNEYNLTFDDSKARNVLHWNPESFFNPK